MALVSKAFGDIITFTRASGATWTNPAGNIVGVDFSATSNTIGTGSKTFTLSATAGVNRSWASGDSVLISDQSNSANNMTGTVTSYTAATQTLVVNVTSTGGSGTIASWRVGSLMPRFDYDPVTLAAKGLLIEEQRTNLLTYSEQFDNAAWSPGTGGSISANTVIAPDGNTSADAYTWPSGGGSFAFLSQSVTGNATTTHTFSIWLKRPSGSGSRTVRLVMSDVALSTAQGPTVTVTEQWQRFDFSRASANNTGSIGVGLIGGVTGVSMAAGEIVHVWGAQLEAGSFATSYIPTVASQVTRTPDSASVNTLSPWYNATEGTLYAEATSLNIGIHREGVATFFEDSLNHIGAGRDYAGGTITSYYGLVYLGGVTQAYLAAGTLTAGVTYKAAFAFKTNDVGLSVNGSAAVTDSSASLPSGISVMRIGRTADVSERINGHIRRITYYPRRLSNAELQAITA